MRISTELADELYIADATHRRQMIEINVHLQVWPQLGSVQYTSVEDITDNEDLTLNAISCLINNHNIPCAHTNGKEHPFRTNTICYLQENMGFRADFPACCYACKTLSLQSNISVLESPALAEWQEWDTWFLKQPQ